MPSTETPPEIPKSAREGGGGRRGRYGDLDHSDLVHLLDEVDDERARARFREAIYLSLICWMLIGFLVIFGPRYLPHAPRVMSPNEATDRHKGEMTYLETPRDLPRSRPTPRAAAPAPKAEVAPKVTEQPPAARAPQMQKQAPAPKSLPAAPQPQASAAGAPPPPKQQATPTPTPVPASQRPTQQALADAPRPAPTRPNFGQGGGQTAGDAIRRAAQAAAQGSSADVGAGSAPVGRSGGLNTGVDVLSDTMGVDFNPYLKKILRQIYESWIPLIPEEARPPLNKQGETDIRFTILPDGRIGVMHLDGSTHDDALNRAAWYSIPGVGQFPPLPSQFHGPNLELRIHYLVNKKPE